MSVDKGAVLIALARQAIADRLGVSVVAPDVEVTDWLQANAATFVTLTMHDCLNDGLNDNLRGCIGTLEPFRPLMDDVQANAVAAAFHDPRFSPLAADEFGLISIEVSLLSPMQPFSVSDESDACARIRPHVDGVVLEYGAHKATFLPQVWDQLPEPRQFMAHLKQKAGLSADFWHPDVRLYIYQVDKFRETGAS